MRRIARTVAFRAGLAALALASGACQQAATNAAADNVMLAPANSAVATPAPEPAAPSPSSAAENGQREAEEAALSAAENATGPVALASDSELPRSCQAYVRAIQTCITRIRAGEYAENRERLVRRMLHGSRTETWPAWARSDFLERGCTGQAAGLTTAFREC